MALILFGNIFLVFTRFVLTCFFVMPRSGLLCYFKVTVRVVLRLRPLSSLDYYRLGGRITNVKERGQWMIEPYHHY